MRNYMYLVQPKQRFVARFQFLQFDQSTFFSDTCFCFVMSAISFFVFKFCFYFPSYVSSPLKHATRVVSHDSTRLQHGKKKMVQQTKVTTNLLQCFEYNHITKINIPDLADEHIYSINFMYYQNKNKKYINWTDRRHTLYNM